MATNTLSDQRRQRLLEMVRVRRFASMPELAEAMEVSESTVRRDVEHLEEQGTAKRTHGGVFYTGAAPRLEHFEQRQASNWDKKKMIGAAVAKLVEDGDTLLLDGGSTTYEVAQQLVGRPIQIVTNSLPVANLFLSSPTTDLVLVGGWIHARTGVSMGAYANTMISRLNVRRTILSVAAINDRGYYNSNLMLVETERAMMGAADEVMIVADSGKFGHQSLALLDSLNSVARVVVDHEISEDWRSKLNAVEVTVTIAGPTDNG